MVCITDGRANVSLARSNDDPDALATDAPKATKDDLNEEVLDMAKKFGTAGFQLLVIDTENKFVSTGVALSSVTFHTLLSHMSRFHAQRPVVVNPTTRCYSSRLLFLVYRGVREQVCAKVPKSMPLQFGECLGF